jgi:4-hydroxy-tetrahydrodipicolinate reductase
VRVGSVTVVIRVGVTGAAGRMGQTVCEAVRAAPDLVLAAAVDPALAARAGPRGAGGQAPPAAAPGGGPGPVELGPGELGPVELGPVELGPVVSTEVTALVEAEVDVVVDFTAADAARSTLPWCAAQGIHAVVGTTGLGADDLAELRRAFDGTRANAVVAPNFAIGAVLLMRFCELAAPYMDGVEVIEMHHDAKRDAPSGTALRTAERIAEARAAAGMPALPADATTQMVLGGARGGEGAGGVRVHSVRLPGLVAHQEVVFGAEGQSLIVRHDSYDRRSFMPGVLLAVRSVGTRPGLTLGLEPLLGLS